MRNAPYLTYINFKCIMQTLEKYNVYSTEIDIFVGQKKDRYWKFHMVQLNIDKHGKL